MENFVIGDVVIVDDGIVDGSQVCNLLENVEVMEGKIVIIDWGGCEFGLKLLNVQEVGVIGVIICNFEDVFVGMVGGVVGGQVIILVVLFGNVDC